MSAPHIVEVVVAALLLLGAVAARRDRRPRRWYRSGPTEGRPPGVTIGGRRR